MTRDDIIALACQAGVAVEEQWQAVGLADDFYMEWAIEVLLRVAPAIKAAERERLNADSTHTCHAQCPRPACVAVREAVAAEREACARMVDHILKEGGGTYGDAIRARRS